MPINNRRGLLMAMVIACGWGMPVQAAPGSGLRCQFAAKSLIGGWRNVKNGFFEEMDFSYSGSERIFNSWLHQRPEISNGSWTMENCRISIRHATEKAMTVVYQVIRFKGGRLYLREVGERRQAVYQRIEENPHERGGSN